MRDRNRSGRFGSESYSREKLVAKLAATMLCGVAGIAPLTIDNTTSYLAGWLKAFKDDEKMLVWAARPSPTDG